MPTFKVIEPHPIACLKRVRRLAEPGAGHAGDLPVDRGGHTEVLSENAAEVTGVAKSPTGTDVGGVAVGL